MEDLAPPLHSVVSIRMNLECGLSFRLSLLKVIEASNDTFHSDLKEWVFLLDQGRDPSPVRRRQKSFYRIMIMDLYLEGLRGHAVVPVLKEIEKELWEVSLLEIEREAGRLALISLIPVFLFMLPAMLILVFGPLLSQVVETLSN